jgi:hypothetical protein
MAADVTLTLGIAGKSLQRPGFGSRSFKRDVAGQGFAPELEVPVPANAVDQVLALPAMASQRYVVIVTDNPVTFRYNAELVGLNRLIELNGIVVLPATPIITQLLFTGNGATLATVYVLPVGN